jgi:hypothetical protein
MPRAPAARALGEELDKHGEERSCAVAPTCSPRKITDTVDVTAKTVPHVEIADRDQHSR